MVTTEDQAVGRNGVVITRRAPRDGEVPQYRTYEVYQRERVGESTEKIRPSQLTSDAYRRDPYALLEILRENYPCYRDWSANSFWITRYDDVTSLFTDDANFESRSRCWSYGIEHVGRNLSGEMPALVAEEQLTDALAVPVAERVINDLLHHPAPDLATGFALRFSLELLAETWAIPVADQSIFAGLVWRMQRGVSMQPALLDDARRAVRELTAYLEPLLAERAAAPGEDYLSVLASLELESGPVTASDLVVTLLERDFETLHGSLANLWFLLMTHPDEYEKARSDRRLMKLAYLETLRHSTPVTTTYRFARHEIERFGRLLPEGARLVLSAAAANRDPRVFQDPDRFIVDRRDMCQREPRGQYRADGLATGIAFGLGKPSRYPAVPEDRPRSRYAITRDTAVTASALLAERTGLVQLAPGSSPALVCRSLGEMHTCWQLPVVIEGCY